MIYTIKNYWILILLSIGGIYSYIEFGSYPHLIFSILTLALLFSIAQIKDVMKNRLLVGIYLVLIVIWHTIDMIIENEVSLYKLISSISFAIISIILLTNNTEKIAAIRGDSTIASLAMLFVSSFVCYQFSQSSPYDFLELITIIVSAIFSVILSWFLFVDVTKKK